MSASLEEIRRAVLCNSMDAAAKLLGMPIAKLREVIVAGGMETRRARIESMIREHYAIRGGKALCKLLAADGIDIQPHALAVRASRLGVARLAGGEVEYLRKRLAQLEKRLAENMIPLPITRAA